MQLLRAVAILANVANVYQGCKLASWTLAPHCIFEQNSPNFVKAYILNSTCNLLHVRLYNIMMKVSEGH